MNYLELDDKQYERLLTTLIAVGDEETIKVLEEQFDYNPFDHFHERVMQGHKGKCPMCRRHAQMYKRALNANMAYGLLLIYQWHQSNGWNTWCHIPSLFTEEKAVPGNDGALLRHWKLLEQRPPQLVYVTGNPREGYYRITEHGKAFAEGRIKVPKYYYHYDQKLIGLSDGLDGRLDVEFDVHEALGTKFNYRETMMGLAV